MARASVAIPVENVTRCGYPQHMAEMTERDRRLRTLRNAVISAATIGRVSADDIRTTVREAIEEANRENLMMTSAMNYELPTIGRV